MWRVLRVRVLAMYATLRLMLRILVVLASAVFSLGARAVVGPASLVVVTLHTVLGDTDTPAPLIRVRVYDPATGAGVWAVTDVTGTARVSVPTGPDYHAQIDQPGYASNDGTDPTLRVFPGVDWDATVLAPDGSPAAGASQSLLSLTGRSRVVFATADAHGRVFRRLPAGGYHARIAWDGAVHLEADLEIHAPAVKQSFQLSAPGSVRVHARCGGVPCRGVVISYRAVVGSDASGYTADAGEWQFDGLAPAMFAFKASRDTCTVNELRGLADVAVVARGVVDVSIDLAPVGGGSASISGRVTDAHGDPAFVRTMHQGARVSVECAQVCRYAAADEHGQFRVDNLPTGERCEVHATLWTPMNAYRSFDGGATVVAPGAVAITVR